MPEKNYSVIKKALTLLWEDIKSAKWVIILIIAYFALMSKILYSLCPMVLVTGYPCPACGLTRAGLLLLHLDFSEAFSMHPFIYPIAAYIVLFAWNRYIRQRRMPEWMKWCAVIIMVGMICYYIWRMYTYFPGDSPMSYYSFNMIHRIKALLLP